MPVLSSHVQDMAVCVLSLAISDVLLYLNIKYFMVMIFVLSLCTVHVTTVYTCCAWCFYLPLPAASEVLHTCSRGSKGCRGVPVKPNHRERSQSIETSMVFILQYPLFFNNRRRRRVLLVLCRMLGRSKVLSKGRGALHGNFYQVMRKVQNGRHQRI